MASNVDVDSTSNTAASSLVQLFLNSINKQDVNGLIHVQTTLIDQLEKTNEKLESINKLSAQHYLDASRNFSNHTQLLTTMKTDLDLIFKRIKTLKTRLNKKYPEAYTTAVQMAINQRDSIDDEDEDDLSSLKSYPNPSLVKSKTIDGSQLSSTMHETYSLADMNSNSVESSSNSFDVVRRFVLEKSPGGQDLTNIFKNAREELRKFNEGFLGGTTSKPSTSHND